MRRLELWLLVLCAFLIDLLLPAELWAPQDS
jgi:hypothetical protein